MTKIIIIIIGVQADWKKGGSAVKCSLGGECSVSLPLDVVEAVSFGSGVFGSHFPVESSLSVFL